MQIKPLFLTAALGVATIAAVALVAATAVEARATAPTPAVAVGPQYSTTHVYVAPEDVDRFAQSFLATFGLGGGAARRAHRAATMSAGSRTNRPCDTLSMGMTRGIRQGRWIAARHLAVRL